MWTIELFVSLRFFTPSPLDPYSYFSYFHMNALQMVLE